MADLLTVREACAITGVKERTIRSRISRGLTPYQLVDGRQMLTRQQALDLKAALEAEPPEGHVNIHTLAERTGLTHSGVRARSKILGLTPYKAVDGGWWWSQEQTRAMMEFKKSHGGGMRAGWRKFMPENHGIERHGDAADASIAMCQTRKTMDPVAILRRVAQDFPPIVTSHGVTHIALENSIIHDIMALLVKDARERNKGGGNEGANQD